MSDHVEGIVAKISEKETNNGGTIYNVCIEADGQDDEWFGYGFDEPDFQEGDEIEFDIEWNGKYANVDKGTVNIISEGDGGRKPASRGNSRSSGRSSGGGRQGSGRSSGRSNSRSSSKPSNSRSKPAAKRGGNRGAAKGATDDKMSKEEWANKDKIIRRQACMNTAIQLIGAAVKCELVALPTKKADKLDAFIALCDEEAIRLYDQYEEQVYGGGTKKRGGNRGRDDYDDDIPE